MVQENTHPSLKHQMFPSHFEVEKEVDIQAQKDETFRHELQANPRAVLEHNSPQQLPEGRELQGFSIDTIEEKLLSKSTSRCALLAASALAAIGMTGCMASPTKAIEVATPTADNTSTTSDPLQKLLDGNQRFQRGQATWPNQTVARRQAVAQKQTPFAMIFGCVDSRVPPELVFDQGLGDLLIIRTAANVLDTAALGSIEFGVVELNIPLLVVLGHERCGGVTAAIQAIDNNKPAPGSIQSLVEYLRPSILKAQGQGDARVVSAIHNNIAYTINKLSGSKIISDAVNAEKLTIVGSYYDLDTGAVSVLKS